MSQADYRAAKRYLDPTPFSRAGAYAASAVAAAAFALFLPLCYLFVDLLVRGRPGGEFAKNARAVPWLAEQTASGAGLLNLILLSVLALVLVRGVAQNLAAYLATKATLDAGARLRRAVYTHGQRLSSVAIRPDAQAEAGELVSRKVDDIQDAFSASMTTGVRTAVSAILLAGVLFASHIWLTIAAVAVAALVWLVAGGAAAWFRREARIAGRRTESRLGLIRESLSGTQLSKAYLMERFAQTRFERHLSDLSKSAWRKTRGETFSRPTLLAIVTGAALVVIYLGARLVLAGEMSLAALVTKGVALAALVVALARFLAVQVRVRRAGGAAADVLEFLDRRGDVAQTVDAEFLQPMQKRLEFVGVTLDEPGTERTILDGVSFAVPAKSVTAIIAGTAEEGRAVAHLMTRFADPTSGEVRIDGKNTRWVTYESIRTQVALVLENALTFSDTVANNIGCGDPAYTLPQIVHAAKLAHAHQFVQRLPYGYETRVGTGGMSLNPGERFRIALARAILRDPSLLIIEEPYSPLDADSQVLIDDTISRVRAGRTVVFLARRPSTVRSADAVVVLRHGKVSASGSHDELMDASEQYRQFHLKQALLSGSNQ